MEQNEVAIKDLDRVRDYGEVFTPKAIVQAMLDLINDECNKIDSRFLEPACGDGNFLVAILKRKLEVVATNHKATKMDFEVQALCAIASIYGIDLLADNVEVAKKRMFDIICACYKKHLKSTPDSRYKKIINFILDKNILLGDALNPKNIIFTQWTLGDAYKIKMEEFNFENLACEDKSPDCLFTDDDFIKAIREYPPIYYRDLGA